MSKIKKLDASEAPLMLQANAAQGALRVEIYNMVILFKYGEPFAFRRGTVTARRVQGTLNDRYPNVALNTEAADYDPLADGSFEKALADNLRAAMRKLSPSYDIVAESTRFTDILLKAADQLEIIARNKWTDPELIRDAVEEARVFMLERLVGVFKESNSGMHIKTVGNISTQMLKDALQAGRLRPTNEAVEEDA